MKTVAGVRTWWCARRNGRGHGGGGRHLGTEVGAVGGASRAEGALKVRREALRVGFSRDLRKHGDPNPPRELRARALRGRRVRAEEPRASRRAILAPAGGQRRSAGPDHISAHPSPGTAPSPGRGAGILIALLLGSARRRSVVGRVSAETPGSSAYRGPAHRRRARAPPCGEERGRGDDRRRRTSRNAAFAAPCCVGALLRPARAERRGAPCLRARACGDVSAGHA